MNVNTNLDIKLIVDENKMQFRLCCKDGSINLWTSLFEVHFPSVQENSLEDQNFLYTGFQSEIFRRNHFLQQKLFQKFVKLPFVLPFFCEKVIAENFYDTPFICNASQSVSTITSLISDAHKNYFNKFYLTL